VKKDEMMEGIEEMERNKKRLRGLRIWKESFGRVLSTSFRQINLLHPRDNIINSVIPFDIEDVRQIIVMIEMDAFVKG